MGILHHIADFVGISQDVRNHVVSRWRAFTRWTPPYFQPVTKWCLNTEPRDVKITLSLTSYPGRIKSVHRVITTLLNQTIRPDRVILWLGDEKFPRREEDLPRRLLDLKQFGLTIGWCHDQRSYTKLLPSLRAFPDDIIITFDDDTLYPPHLVELLYASYLEFPKAVHSQIALEVEGKSNGEFVSYNKWKHCIQRGRMGYDILLLGYGGVLYPPHVLGDKVDDERTFMEIAATTDDLWFWAMAVLSGVPIRTLGLGGGRQCGDPCANTANALWNVNISETVGNNQNFLAILDAFPIVKERLKETLRCRQ